MKNKTMTMLQTGRIDLGVLDFPDLGFILALVCFGFRASNFGFASHP
jgi:hypothetical protein